MSQVGIEDAQQVKVVAGNKIGSVGAEVAFSVKGKSASGGDVRIDDFWLLKLGIIIYCVLNFVPLIASAY